MHQKRIFRQIDRHLHSSLSECNFRPLSAHQRNASRMAFRWRADSGPMCVHTEKCSSMLTNRLSERMWSWSFSYDHLTTMRHMSLVAEYMIMENLANPINTGILMDSNICASTNHFVWNKPTRVSVVSLVGTEYAHLFKFWFVDIWFLVKPESGTRRVSCKAQMTSIYFNARDPMYSWFHERAKS